MSNSVLSQIATLQEMNTPQLQGRWKELFGEIPLQSNRGYLQRRLAYRIQELAFGGDPTIEKRLESLYKQQRTEHRRKSSRLMKPLVGTKLVREYKGVEHHVTVLPDGFEYNGMRFTSLTRIACDITGTWISGPNFFGLLTKRNKGATA